MNWNQTRFGRLCILKQNAAFDDALRRNRGRRWSGEDCGDESTRLRRDDERCKGRGGEVEKATAHVCVEADRPADIEEDQREA